MKKILYIAVLIIIALGGSTLWGHVDNYMLPEGCGSCHVGHGVIDQPMLAQSEEQMCYQCHGSSEKQSAMKSAGLLAQQANPQNVEQVFSKIYRHPVVEGTGHSPTEKLPNLTSSVDHAECVDCHNPHQRISPGPKTVYDVKGYSLSGQYLDQSMNEYEICLKCHATNDLKSSGQKQKDMLRAFANTVKSQHPVTVTGTGSKSVSLTKSLGPANSMKCSDCHTNDDTSGPKGPHGSNYPFLLSGNYDTDIYASESSYAFEFCYSCHDRSIILSNRSFPLHREHILGDPFKNIPGTSCYTCHASHSSEDYPYLIEFNPEAVTNDEMTHQIRFESFSSGNGRCYLTCHGKAHSPEEYQR